MNRPLTSLGGLAFLGFLACVPLANWMIGHAGTVCVPNNPCLIPVAPGIMAPSHKIRRRESELEVEDFKSNWIICSHGLLSG